MATKTKSHPLNGLHTAGIFSDMSVDGPQIGTLVLVVDRAKNLPNRKTIGKQDPYCAARLGKEAKKTTTDIRGGQTPKWDQELRFTVHDSPDYYQLKVSVFNDDKKTELIGESWIDLRDIIISGGGQSDQWHQLACKGKYAGEVRIEITFYDSRPKPEKSVVKAKPPVTAEPESAPSSAATAGPRTMPKRRPLPSDPVTGMAPPSPTPEAIETPPRPQPNPHMQSQPSQQAEYHTPPPALPGNATRYQDPADDYPVRAPSGEFGTPSRRMDFQAQQHRTPERQGQYQGHPEGRGYFPHHQSPSHDRYDSRVQEQHEFPQLDHQRARSFEEDRPPPPPAHRTRTGSNPAMNTSYQTGAGTAMRHDVLRNEALRQSGTASYPGRPTYKAYDSAPSAPLSSQYSNPDQPSPPRHYSYDAAYDSSYRPMQATVEDVPESPDSINNSWNRRGSYVPHSRSLPQIEPEYDMAASPAPLNLSRGNQGPAHYQGAHDMPDQHRRQESNGYTYAPSPPAASQREVSGQSASRHYGRHSESSLVSYGAPPDQHALPYRSELDDTSGGYGMPLVPASLVPGMDPGIAQEISDRFHQDRNHQRRYTQPPTMETPPRGRTMSEIPRRYEGTPPGTYNSGPPPQSRGQLTYTGGPSTSSVNVVIKQRNYSPNPPQDSSPSARQTIRRKSVSPAPPPAEPRRLSGVPFGPDSYDAFNPAVNAAAVREPATTRPDYDEKTGMIITHDGREVDPSDHLPMETWAPEPEPKKPSNPASSSSSSRPSPSGAQPLPPSGRRGLRLGARAQSMAPGSGIQFSSDAKPAEPATPSPPASTGRNRLQKKAHRSSMAAGPVMSGALGRSSDVGSSPLAPLPSHQDNFTPPRQISRASTFDYPGSNENHAPVLYGSGYSPSPNSGRGQGPPAIPAKVPLALPPPPGPVMSGALQLHSSSLARRGDMDDWDGYDNGSGGRERDMWGGGGGSTLEEELSRIDIGTGRSRRRGY
ncbi:ingression protein fic1 [Echria macrotheca]|uniref:Ingression protein fic1 n=1 Tax=Echria macrotheca TaxID=438768 RepID=A0AAJ0BEI0_9PEZI|nr:ingression protein fic1 [Echria macrotheca]